MMAIPLSEFKRIASDVIDEWYPVIQSYHFNGYQIIFDVKYNKRDSTYKASVEFDEDGNFRTINNPYGQRAPGAIGYELERRLKKL